MKILLTLLISSLMVISACSTMTPAEIDSKRNALDDMAAKAIAGLKEKESDLHEKLDKSLAYGVANMKLTKIPIVGAGGGEGVFVINNTQQRIYFTVSRFDVGGGWGVRSYKLLMVVNTQEIVDKWKDGNWEFKAGAEASAGTSSVEGSSSGLNEGFTAHILSDGGASATVTARIIRMKINRQLMAEP